MLWIITFTSLIGLSINGDSVVDLDFKKLESVALNPNSLDKIPTPSQLVRIKSRSGLTGLQITRQSAKLVSSVSTACMSHTDTDSVVDLDFKKLESVALNPNSLDKIPTPSQLVRIKSRSGLTGLQITRQSAKLVSSVSTACMSHTDTDSVVDLDFKKLESVALNPNSLDKIPTPSQLVRIKSRSGLTGLQITRQSAKLVSSVSTACMSHTDTDSVVDLDFKKLESVALNPNSLDKIPTPSQLVRIKSRSGLTGLQITRQSAKLVSSVSTACMSHTDTADSSRMSYHQSGEKPLIQMLLGRYQRHGIVGRPVYNNSARVKVRFGVQIIQILGLDESKQIFRTNCWKLHRWTDPLLKWNASLYDNIDLIQIYPKDIWTPDIRLQNFADDRLHEARDGRLLVYSNGSIVWLQQAVFKSTCQVEITYFPFDTQVCMLEFGSATYDQSLVELDWWSSSDWEEPKAYLDFSDYIPANDWWADGERAGPNNSGQLRSVKDYRLRSQQSTEHQGNANNVKRYPVLRFLIRLQRNPSYHLVTLIFPTLLLSILNMVVFWLPPDSTAKIMLGCNIFTAFFILLLLLAESMPTASKNFPLIGSYLCLNLIMVTFSMFLATIVVNIHYRGNSGYHPVPEWVHKFLTLKLSPRFLNFSPTNRYQPIGVKNDGKVKSDVACHQHHPLATLSSSTDDDKTTLVTAYHLAIKGRPIADKVKCEIDTCLNQLASTRRLLQQARNVRGRGRRRQLIGQWHLLARKLDRVFFLLYLCVLTTTVCVGVLRTNPVDVLAGLNKTRNDW